MLSPESATFLSDSIYELEENTRGIEPQTIDLEDREVNEALWYVYFDSLGVFRQGYQPLPDLPYTAIASMTNRLAEHAEAIGPIDDLDPQDLPVEDDYDDPLEALGCFKAETRLAHSFAKQQQAKQERHPACILFNTDGQPFAYQKGNGVATAFTWQDGYLPTADGPLWVPENAIIRPLYEDGYNPRTIYTDEALLAIRNPHISNAHFIRFNHASWLTTALAFESFRTGSEGASKADIQEAALLSAVRIGQRVLPLVATARTV